MHEGTWFTGLPPHTGDYYLRKVDGSTRVARVKVFSVLEERGDDQYDWPEWGEVTFYGDLTNEPFEVWEFVSDEFEWQHTESQS